MKTIELNAYAKINLAIDILGQLPNGYHEISTVMQLIELYDKVRVKWIPNTSSLSKQGQPAEIELGCNKRFLPLDERNLAYKAAELMSDQFNSDGRIGSGKLRIDIKKQIPVGAGLAGGSADGAAVLLAISKLWNLRLTIFELCKLGEKLGADVPFCVMGQAKANANLLGQISEGGISAATCVHATGTGTTLKPVTGIDSWLILSKPPISVSTAEVYQGYDAIADEIEAHPCIEDLIKALEENNIELMSKNMVNVLENYTRKAYSGIMYTKNKIEIETLPIKALMSGSGPTIFALYENKRKAKAAFEKMICVNRETFLSQTII